MRSTLLAGLLAFAVSKVTSQDTYWSVQSKPFFLVLKSHNQTINGSYLYPCHEGAAIEGLCLGEKRADDYGQFTHNTSAQTPLPTSGLLTWELRGFNFNVSSAMRFQYNDASNVAIPLFFPGNSDYNAVNFTEAGVMNILSYQDDTKPLPNYSGGPLCRWYICTTYYGYLYQTLAWVMGEGKPQNPTCQKVEVIRQWV
ncbi:hypothetical protein BJ875DRAFT_453764 [Amylocarpus encephaloides]|uniref:DUF7907 domain-containing protein n=1 Tax=Amylocarpus encephaloides TaxID=45428 RepID=A0A9P7YPR7_9HELO|nr:hypothetical protein BJ875DRAFT_453764 [Amylocarpus encephaloides]